VDDKNKRLTKPTASNGLKERPRQRVKLQALLVSNINGDKLLTLGVMSSTPGLAVTRTVPFQGCSQGQIWTLTQVTSGLSLGLFFPSGVQASRFAQALRMVDWTPAGTEAQREAVTRALESGLVARSLDDAVWTAESWRRRTTTRDGQLARTRGAEADR
jgi:hypothetical protein